MNRQKIVRSKRTPRKKSGSRRWITILKYTLGSVSLAACCGGLIYFSIHWMQSSSLFVMKNIHIEGHHILSRATIESQLQLQEGTHLLHIDPHALKQSLSELPYIESVSMRRQFPSTLQISITHCELYRLFARKRIN